MHRDAAARGASQQLRVSEVERHRRCAIGRAELGLRLWALARAPEGADVERDRFALGLLLYFLLLGRLPDEQARRVLADAAPLEAACAYQG